MMPSSNKMHAWGHKFRPDSPVSSWRTEAQEQGSKVSRLGGCVGLWPVMLLLLLLLLQQAWRGRITANEAAIQTQRAEALLVDVRKLNSSEASQKEILHTLHQKLEDQETADSKLQSTVSGLKGEQEEQTQLLRSSHEQVEAALSEVSRLETEKKHFFKLMKRHDKVHHAKDLHMKKSYAALQLKAEAAKQQLAKEQKAEAALTKEANLAKAKEQARAEHDAKEHARAEQLGTMLKDLAHQSASEKAKAAKDVGALQESLSRIAKEAEQLKTAKAHSAESVRVLAELLMRHKQREHLSARQVRTMEAQLRRLRAARSEDVWELHEAQQRLQRVGQEPLEVDDLPSMGKSSHQKAENLEDLPIEALLSALK